MACFKGANDLTELHSLTGDRVKQDNTNNVVKKCAKLAKAKGYKLFALGKGGVCLSGPDIDKYLDSGTENAECYYGIGIGDSMFVYSLGKHCRFACVLF